MVQTFIDDKIDHKESDIEKIQTRTGMYIGYLGRKGALHLAKEVIQNMIDECINENSPGRNIDIFLDEKENILQVSDDGRGVPFDKMELICTKLQSGSKFVRDGSGGNTSGENGVGLTAVNALSTMFEIVSRRYNEKATIKFSDGKKTQDLTVKKTNFTDSHGTTFTFKPSEFYLNGDCQIVIDDLMEWLEIIHYMIPKEITMTFQAKRKGKESNINKKYKNKQGLYTYVKKLSEKPILDPIHIVDHTTATELNKGEEYERNVRLELAFTYNSSPDELVADSFCNFVITTGEGFHFDGVKQAMINYFRKETRNSLSERESKNLDIVNNDILGGLVFSLFLSTNLNPQFVGQNKEKVGNEVFEKMMKDMTTKCLTEHFKVNPKDLKKIIDYIKASAKARLAASKVRNSTLKQEKDPLAVHLMKHYTPPNDKSRNGYRELIIIEGDSAGGSAKEGRYSNDFQGIFYMRGVPKNAFKTTLMEAMENEEIRELVKALGIIIDKNGNVDYSKIKFKKIIIMADADIDGYRITSLLCAFFIKHLPWLVEKGYIYKAVTPLYKLKKKKTSDKTQFVLNKRQFVDIFQNNIGNNIKLVRVNDKHTLTKEEMKDFLAVNQEYFDELSRLTQFFGVNFKIIETVTLYCDGKDLGKNISHYFPEITLDKDNMLTGIYQGKFQVLTIDRLFHKRISDFKRLMHDKIFNNGIIAYNVHEKVGKEYIDRGVMTIGELMLMVQKFLPDIQTRFKGLGELNSEELKETSLDPNKRTLIQLTMTDLEEELKKFEVLHGKTTDGKKKLKEMMSMFKIHRDDLDN